MDITFRDKRLEVLANNDRKMIKMLGKARAKKFRLRLSQLRNSQTLEDVRHLPGLYHELTADRKGQWACDLDQPYRLIFEPHEQPVPADQAGRFMWSEIKGIEIIEINDYH